MGTDITVTQLGSPADPTYLVRRGDEFWSDWRGLLIYQLCSSSHLSKVSNRLGKPK